jgi:hypothetical protein
MIDLAIIMDRGIHVVYAVRNLRETPGGWTEVDAYRVVFDGCMPDTEINDQRWFPGGAFRTDDVIVMEIQIND